MLLALALKAGGAPRPGLGSGNLRLFASLKVTPALLLLTWANLGDSMRSIADSGSTPAAVKVHEEVITLPEYKDSRCFVAGCFPQRHACALSTQWPILGEFLQLTVDLAFTPAVVRLRV